MEACATGLGLDKASAAADRAPGDRRVTADKIARLFNRYGKWRRTLVARNEEALQPELPLLASG